MSALLSSSLRVAALVAGFVLVGAHAQAEPGDPPGRVAAVTERQGSVVYAPAGQQEWSDLPLNQPLTQADRLWTDPGARAELHMGSAMVYVAGESNLGFVALDDRNARLSLTQGTLAAHVRELQAGENFEIDTPNVAVRAAQGGDWRVDVDPAAGSTRVTVDAGQVKVFGDAGRAVTLAAGQQASFAARDGQQVESRRGARDGFDQWVAEHRQQEQQSPTAQYVPPEVIGSQQLDRHGVWNQDATYGAVWYPNVTVADWAPYRQGRWAWVAPWGWTWIDDAPWGFAPFHYGRWAMIGSRWAWVPGRIAHRPVYAPALVAFVGGGSRRGFNARGDPGVAWYPLGPGEAWRPGFRASNGYVERVNRFHGGGSQGRDVHVHSRLAGTVTVPRFAQPSPGFVQQPQHGFGRGQGRSAPQMQGNQPPQFVQRQQVQPMVGGEDRGRHRGWERGNRGDGGNGNGNGNNHGERGGRGHWQRER